MSFFRSFYQTPHRLCAFNPCARTAQDLRLKVVIHAGEVAIEHIHGFDKLFYYEGIGAVKTVVFYPPAPPAAVSSFMPPIGNRQICGQGCMRNSIQASGFA